MLAWHNGPLLCRADINDSLCDLVKVILAAEPAGILGVLLNKTEWLGTRRYTGSNR